MLANIAGFVLVVAGIQILGVNRRFLPAALRPPLWREAGLLVCVAFHAFFSWFGLRAVLAGLSSSELPMPPRLAYERPQADAKGRTRSVADVAAFARGRKY